MVLYKVYMIVYIEWGVVLQTKGGILLKGWCDDTHSVAVMSYTMDMMSSYIAHEITKIHLM